MKLEYYRPKTLDEAVNLIMRSTPRTIPIGGGTSIRKPDQTATAFVDLQNLDLAYIHSEGNILKVGATTKLEAVVSAPEVPMGLQRVILDSYTKNHRQMSSFAGALVAGGGRSLFCAALLAMDAKFIWAPDDGVQLYAEYLPLRTKPEKKAFIKEVQIPTNIQFGFDYVARTPRDLPIVGGCIAKWSSGRTRVTLCGYGNAPICVMDGTSASGAVNAAMDAYSQAGDQWASSDYRQEISGKIIERILIQLS